jgi:hypothetical protein
LRESINTQLEKAEKEKLKLLQDQNRAGNGGSRMSFFGPKSPVETVLCEITIDECDD